MMGKNHSDINDFLICANTYVELIAILPRIKKSAIKADVIYQFKNIFIYQEAEEVLYHCRQ